MYKPIVIERSRKYGSSYWEAFSPKIQRIVRFYSDLEYDNYILVETNPNVINFCEQPLKLLCKIEDQEINTIFDMWVLYKDQSECFIEIKYSVDLDSRNPKSDRLIRQINAQHLWCNKNGYDFKMVTEESIRSNRVFLANMKTILSYIKRNKQPIESYERIIVRFISQSRLTVNQIFSLLPCIQLERIKEAIAWMIYQGKVLSNIETCFFGSQTEVWFNAE